MNIKEQETIEQYLNEASSKDYSKLSTTELKDLLTIFKNVSRSAAKPVIGAINRELNARMATEETAIDEAKVVPFKKLEQAWTRTNGDKAKQAKLIKKHDLKKLISTVRPGEIKLGVKNKLLGTTKAATAAGLDLDDELIFVTNNPLKIIYPKKSSRRPEGEEIKESVDIAAARLEKMVSLVLKENDLETIKFFIENSDIDLNTAPSKIREGYKTFINENRAIVSNPRNIKAFIKQAEKKFPQYKGEIEQAEDDEIVFPNDPKLIKFFKGAREVKFVLKDSVEIEEGKDDYIVVIQGAGDNNQKIVKVFKGTQLNQAKKYRDDWNKKNANKIKKNKKGQPMAAHGARLYNHPAGSTVNGKPNIPKVGDSASWSTFGQRIIKEEACDLDEAKNITVRALRQMMFKLDSSAADKFRKELFKIDAQDSPASNAQIQKGKKIAGNKFGRKDFTEDAIARAKEKADLKKKHQAEIEREKENIKDISNEDTDLDEASKSDIKKVLDAGKKAGGKIKGNTIDFCMGAKIDVSLEKGKIKLDGGRDGVELFKNVKDALMAFEETQHVMEGE
jgi:hypothetical protein